jgi:hypothetical protein
VAITGHRGGRATELTWGIDGGVDRWEIPHGAEVSGGARGGMTLGAARGGRRGGGACFAQAGRPTGRNQG